MTDACLHCINMGCDGCRNCDQQGGDKTLYQTADVAELQRRRNILIDACFFAIAGEMGEIKEIEL